MFEILGHLPYSNRKEFSHKEGRRRSLSYLLLESVSIPLNKACAAGHIHKLYYSKCPKFCLPKFLTKWYIQTVQTQIRLLLIRVGIVYHSNKFLRNNCIKSKIQAKMYGIKCVKFWDIYHKVMLSPEWLSYLEVGCYSGLWKF